MVTHNHYLLNNKYTPHWTSMYNTEQFELEFYFSILDATKILLTTCTFKPVSEAFKKSVFCYAKCSFTWKLTCIKQLPAIKCHFTKSLEWLLKTGLTWFQQLMEDCTSYVHRNGLYSTSVKLIRLYRNATCSDLSY